MELQHGGNIYDGSLERFRREGTLLDFSANINPLGMPEGVRRAVTEALDQAVHYPDPLCRRLKSDLSEYHKVPEDFLICGNGGADLIYRLAYALRPKRALLTAPTFSEYEEALKQTGTELLFYRMEADLEVRKDILEQMEQRPHVMFLCNPNNPTGILTDQELLIQILKKAEHLGIFLVLDECFLDFVKKPENYSLLQDLPLTCLELTVANTHRILENPADREAREALGLATDLGGYAIMVGGTSGAHLTSFSLVDLTAHGTACGIMNPYYAVFYSPAIQPQLEAVGGVLKKYGFMEQDPSELKGRERAEAVARGMIAFGRSVGAPVQLSELPGFSEKYVDRILTAAKDPSLSMKLKNMPVPMTAADVDEYMEPVIRAAVDGDLSQIVNK